MFQSTSRLPGDVKGPNWGVKGRVNMSGHEHVIPITYREISAVYPVPALQYYSPITATHKLDSHPKSSRVLRPSYVINLFFAPCRAHAVAVRHIQRSLEHSVWCMV